MKVGVRTGNPSRGMIGKGMREEGEKGGECVTWNSQRVEEGTSGREGRVELQGEEAMRRKGKRLEDWKVKEKSGEERRGI